MTTSVPTRRWARLKNKRSDIIGTLILGVLGATAALMGFGYQVFVDGGQVGPGFMPVVVGLFIFGASALELGRILLASDALKEDSMMGVVEDVQQDAKEQVSDVGGAQEVDNLGRTAKQRNRAPLYIFVVLAVALLLVDLLGLVVSFALAVAFMIIVIERRPWWVGLIATACAVAFIYVVFKLILNIPLPSGYLGLI